ncbi:MAG: L-rhamnose/proton symporter RhaT [Terriglobia bacterium]
MSESAGFLLIILGGFMQGTFFLGLKWTNPWKWENIWFTYALFALIVIPIVLAVGTAPQLGHVLSATPGKALALVFFYGAGWGVGAVLSGLGVDRMGLAMGVAVLIGITAALGSLIPLVVNTPQLVFQPKGIMVIVSVLVLLLGVALVGVAGKKRDDTKRANAESGQKGSFRAGLIICIFSGIFSAMLNLAFSFSKALEDAAKSFGASSNGAQNYVWMVALGGGFIANAIYTCYLLSRNKTWRNFALPKSGRVFLIGLAMALLWVWGMIFYGRGATVMGELGTVVGWPVFMATIIIFSGIWGFVTGEWKGSSSRAKWYMTVGIVVLVAASALLGVTNRM